jgi:hypothetical protein
MPQELTSEKDEVKHNLQNVVLQQKLTETENSALIRLATTLEQQRESATTNYSRMHHRHNRS